LNNAVDDSIVYPSFERKQNHSDFHYPFLYFKVDTNYLDKGFILGSNNIFSTGGVPLTALAGTINHKILYFGCNSFSLLKSYLSTTQNNVQPVLQYFLDFLKNLSPNIKGIIIDVRSNLGGDLSDLNFLVGHLIEKPLHFGYTQYKSGNGRLDFTPWINAVINPAPNTKPITLPIIALADNTSASLSEAVVMAIHSIPNGVFIGETTWGATGPITAEGVFNAGQFTVSNFLSVQTSSCKFKYLDGKSYEGKGFPPDVYVPFNLSKLQNGKDVQLEKAIDYIK
jgi:C-terminal processing protease CtpA/Prc